MLRGGQLNLSGIEQGLQALGYDVLTWLFRFLDDASIPPTKNSSEQPTRIRMVCREVTDGLCAAWGRDLVASARSIVNTGRLPGPVRIASHSKGPLVLRCVFDLAWAIIMDMGYLKRICKKL
jgi:hypothetical protein